MRTMGGVMLVSFLLVRSAPPWAAATGHWRWASHGGQGLTQGGDGVGHRRARRAGLAERVEHHEVVGEVRRPRASRRPRGSGAPPRRDARPRWRATRVLRRGAAAAGGAPPRMGGGRA